MIRRRLSPRMVRRLVRRGGLTPTPTPAPGLQNTALPTISPAVIGTPMQKLEAGAYSQVPDSIVDDWQVDGVSKGASYTPVEADRTKTITVVETATKAGLNNAVTSSAGAVCRRTEPAIAYPFGKLTPLRQTTSHWGKVRLRYLMAATGRYCIGDLTAAAPTTWTLDSAAGDGGVISGTAAHWDWTIGDGFTPCRAAAIAGDYTFRTKATWADGVVEFVNITITAKDNTFTFSDYDLKNYGFLLKTSAGKITAVDLADGSGRLEFAVGFYFAEGEGSVTLQLMQPVHTMTVAWADESRIGRCPGFHYDQCNNLIIEKPVTVDSVTTATGGSYRLNLTTVTNVIVNDFQHLPPLDTPSPTFASAGINIGTATDLTINNPKMRFVGNGIISALSLSTTRVRINSPEIDRFNNNGMILGGDSAQYGITNDIAVFDALITRPVASGNHIDAVQVSDTCNGGTVKFVRTIVAQAGGTGSGQGLFVGSTGNGVLFPTDVPVNGWLSDTADANGIFIRKGNNSTIQNAALTKTNSVNGGAGGIAGTGPNFNAFADASVAGTCTLKDSIFKGSITLGPFVDGGGNTAYAGTENAAHFQSGMTPTAYLAQFSDAVLLTKTAAEIRAIVKAAWRPAVGSPLDGHGPIDATTGDWNAALLAVS